MKSNDKQFLLFPQHFLPIQRTFVDFASNFELSSANRLFWKRLKLVIWERVNLIGTEWSELSALY